MTSPLIAPRLVRTLVAVYRFYDVFLFPPTVDSVAVDSPLEVSIPSLGWTAIRSEIDATYRFSLLSENPLKLTNTHEVVVSCPDNSYLNQKKITITFPRVISDPPTRGDFLIDAPLWPTTALRTPTKESAIRGRIAGGPSKPVGALAVEIWTDGGASPPANTPSTLTDENGEFLYRFPRLKGSSGSVINAKIRLNGGSVPVTPPTFSLELGRSQIQSYQRN